MPPCCCASVTSWDMRVARNADAGGLALLANRATGASVCPSEVARPLVVAASGQNAQSSWRNAMPAVHAAIDLFAANGSVQLTWKGKPLVTRSGPYRIGRRMAN